jgi:hypothetical protein
MWEGCVHALPSQLDLTVRFPMGGTIGRIAIQFSSPVPVFQRD